MTKGLKTRKKYKVKVYTLEKVCKKYSIKIINYLHIDAQGNDLRVIKSLKNFKKCLIEGVAEVPKSDKLKIYNKEHSFKFLEKKIKRVEIWYYQDWRSSKKLSKLKYLL